MEFLYILSDIEFLRLKLVLLSEKFCQRDDLYNPQAACTVVVHRQNG